MGTVPYTAVPAIDLDNVLLACRTTSSAVWLSTRGVACGSAISEAAAVYSPVRIDPGVPLAADWFRTSRNDSLCHCRFRIVVMSRQGFGRGTARIWLDNSLYWISWGVPGCDDAILLDRRGL